VPAEVSAEVGDVVAHPPTRHNGILRYQLDIQPATMGFTPRPAFGSPLNPPPPAPSANPSPNTRSLLRSPHHRPTNLVAAINCRDHQDLGRYLTGRGGLLGIRTIETTPIIRTVKRAGALLL
jgi:hypothetical protein